jgi:hypothetical protein
MIDLFHRLYGNTGFAFLDWRMLVMWAVVAVLLYLAHTLPSSVLAWREREI